MSGVSIGVRLKIFTFIWRLSWAMNGDIEVSQIIFVRNRVDAGNTEFSDK